MQQRVIIAQPFFFFLQSSTAQFLSEQLLLKNNILREKYEGQDDTCMNEQRIRE